MKFWRKRKKAGFEAIGHDNFTVRLNGADNLLTGRFPTPPRIEISTPTGEVDLQRFAETVRRALIDLERGAA